MLKLSCNESVSVVLSNYIYVYYVNFCKVTGLPIVFSIPLAMYIKGFLTDLLKNIFFFIYSLLLNGMPVVDTREEVARNEGNQEVPI